LREFLSRSAGRRPHATALAADGRELTWRQLEQEAAGAAGRLKALGVGEGDRVATTLAPGVAFVALMHACWRLGAALVPLNTRLTGGELSRQREQAGARLEVGEPLEHGEPHPPRAALNPDEVATVVFTSGTTSTPRAVEHTVANHLASALASGKNLGVEADDRWLGVLPLFHVGGLTIPIRSAIYGTAAEIHAGFHEHAVLEALRSGRVTIVSLVPTMLARLVERGLGRPPRLRAALLGGGPIPARLLEWARETGFPALPTYGMTETTSQVATAEPGELAARPLEGVELRIAPGGEILVRGPQVSAGALAADGWLHTGDRGLIDDRGRLHVEGRIADTIVTGGENVSCAEVEQALLSHPAVREAGVAGVPDAEWGQRVEAWVVADAEAAEILAYARERLAGYKLPKRLHIVDELPRNAAGKLDRRRLLSRVPRP
jgi:O-succinylbenzoic acid--CoA ligase